MSARSGLAALLSGVFLLLSPVTGRATVVLDSATAQPLPRASVFDRKGKLVGFCSDSGVVPVMNEASYPLAVRVMGYATAEVANPRQRSVILSKVDFDLPEVVVESKKRQVLRITAYLREYSTLSTYSDTVLLFREKTVDFMVPTKKAGNFKGWLDPRVLASRSYYHFSGPDGLDSVSNHFGQHFSWSDWIGIFPSRELPQRLRDVTLATDTVYGRYSPSVIWSRDDMNVGLEVDIMADKENRSFMPGLFDLFGRKVEFTQFNIRYLFSGVDGDKVYADNLARMSFNIESNGRGRKVRHLLASDGPAYVDTYAELYVTDLEYISVADACRLEKRPPSAEEIGINAPPDAPELQPAIADLVCRVENFDYIGHRLVEKADPRYAGKTIPEHFQKRPNFVVRALRSIIKDNVWPSSGMQGKFVLGR